MAVEQFPMGPIGVTDPVSVQNIMNKVNPYQVLGDLGLAPTDVDAVLTGDFAPIRNKFQKKISVVDFDKVVGGILKVLPKEICSMFFQRAKASEQFTPEEVELYERTYRRMFDGFFFECADHVFRYEDPADARNLLVRFDGEVYQMTVIGDQAVILFVGEV